MKGKKPTRSPTNVTIAKMLRFARDIVAAGGARVIITFAPDGQAPVIEVEPVVENGSSQVKYLTTRQVALREGLSLSQVKTLAKQGAYDVDETCRATTLPNGHWRIPSAGVAGRDERVIESVQPAAAKKSNRHAATTAKPKSLRSGSPRKTERKSGGRNEDTKFRAKMSRWRKK